MKRIFIALTVALVLLRFGFSLAVAARDEPVALGAAANGVRIGIFVRMIQVNSDWHPMLHVVIANVSKETKQFFPVTSWDNIIAVVDSAGALIAQSRGAPCPTSGNGEIPEKPQNFLLAPGAVRTDDIAFDLACSMKKTGSYSVTLTSEFFFNPGDVGNQLATVVKSNTITVVMP
jgi:hypothetical protein